MIRRVGWAALFVALIVAANYVTARYGFVPVGFGLVATAGTYFAGATFVVRDSLQRAGGPLDTVAVILIGGALSVALSTPALALASAAAFTVSELADLTVYTPLEDRGYVRAALASNVVGTVVDTFLFLTLAGFPLIPGIVAGQIVGKLTLTALVLAAIVAARTRKALA